MVSVIIFRSFSSCFFEIWALLESFKHDFPMIRAKIKSQKFLKLFFKFGASEIGNWRPQRIDLDLAASAGRFGFGGLSGKIRIWRQEGNNNNYQRFRWQEPPGKIMFVLFCFDTCRDDEKETQNINVVGTNPAPPRNPRGREVPGLKKRPNKCFGATCFLNLPRPNK